MGVEALYGAIDVMPVAREIGPSLTAAILSRPHPASRWLDSIREFAPGATIAYDTVDLHWVRETRRFALGSPATNGDGGPLTAKGPKAERAVRAGDGDGQGQRCHDRGDRRGASRQILRAVPQARVLVIPTIHAVAEHVPPVDGRSGVLFVGGFEHPPNADAVKYLVREVMPSSGNTRRTVSVTIVGGSPPAESRAWPPSVSRCSAGSPSSSRSLRRLERWSSRCASAQESRGKSRRVSPPASDRHDARRRRGYPRKRRGEHADRGRCAGTRRSDRARRSTTMRCGRLCRRLGVRSWPPPALRRSSISGSLKCSVRATRSSRAVRERVRRRSGRPLASGGRA